MHSEELALEEPNGLSQVRQRN